jgi:hypothetical protein
MQLLGQIWMQINSFKRFDAGIFQAAVLVFEQ